jgi:hypothetical protein
MAFPRLHSWTWSDEEQTKGKQPAAEGPAAAGPESLQDKELYVWVTYPERNPGGKTDGKKAKHRRKALKLWAVVIVEEVRRTRDFSYEVALKRIFKRGERTIRFSVTNDPADQSDDAKIFGFVSPRPKDLTPLEEHLSHVAAKRVYDAIATTWDRVDEREMSGVDLPDRQPTGCQEIRMAQLSD